MPVVGMGFEVTFLATEEDAVKCGQGEAKVLAQNAGKLKPGGTAKLKIKEARYLGTKQAAWSDDSYYAIPYEGEMNQISRENLGILAGPRANRSVAGIDEKAKIVYFREIFMIGD